MRPVPNQTWIKICGITSLEDARAAADCGADAVGFVFAESKRRIHPALARAIAFGLPSNVMRVGVFMDEKPETVRQIAETVGLDAVQLHGSETASDCASIGRPVIRRFDVRPGVSRDALVSQMASYPAFACLLDPGSGDGNPFDWSVARDIPFRVILAGGLSTENIRQAIRLVHPFGVDVSTGVERAPGRKDPIKIRKFIEEVRHDRHGIR